MKRIKKKLFSKINTIWEKIKAVTTKICIQTQLQEINPNLNMKDPQYHQTLYQNLKIVSKYLKFWKMPGNKKSMEDKSKKHSTVTKIVLILISMKSMITKVWVGLRLWVSK